MNKDKMNTKRVYIVERGERNEGGSVEAAFLDCETAKEYARELTSKFQLFGPGRYLTPDPSSDKVLLWLCHLELDYIQVRDMPLND